ncbi:hypothetical protein [Bacillus paralicheniformis]|uniref:hypothetical protein n=1 Tax=Bacillus paralicheniformis TaxID=1648923 RepID=UPI0011A94AEE|nr:hypothetical protein [Bacillus paralicheniformis]
MKINFGNNDKYTVRTIKEWLNKVIGILEVNLDIASREPSDELNLQLVYELFYKSQTYKNLCKALDDREDFYSLAIKFEALEVQALDLIIKLQERELSV